MFFAKYNPNGELVFVKTLEYSTEELDISVNDDYIFLLTNLSGQADFDPGPGVTLIDGMAHSMGLATLIPDPVFLLNPLLSKKLIFR